MSNLHVRVVSSEHLSSTETLIVEMVQYNVLYSHTLTNGCIAEAVTVRVEGIGDIKKSSEQ